MNVLFLTLFDFDSFNERNIYTDLLREFLKNGHCVYAVSPVEKRKNRKTHLIKGDGVILKLQIGNVQKTNIIEKGLSTMSVEPQLVFAIKKYFSNVCFDLILYSTPPITFYKAVEYVKVRDGAKSYLMLKDIFPQNAVDMGMLSKKGIKAPLYKYFRAKEKRLYAISDRIGCMSPANVEYVLKHNPQVKKRDEKAKRLYGHRIIDVCPNCIEVVGKNISDEERKQVRKKYGIPLDKTVFIYGGNLGKPQGIDFMLKCLHSQRKNNKVFFVIAGSGTEYSKVENYIEKYKPQNIALYNLLQKCEYGKVAAASDIGMIFLDSRFTIPNFPSRMLDYMAAKLPVFAVTDETTDIGRMVVEGKFGWWCKSNDVAEFEKKVKQILKEEWSKKGQLSFEFIRENYSSENVYEIIVNSINEVESEINRYTGK